jgi:hypothetical protein
MIKANDIIKAFDFEPTPGRRERFIIGKVVKVSGPRRPDVPFPHIEVLCTEDTDGFRENHFITIPLPGHAFDDWDERVTVVEKFNREKFFSDWKTAPRTMP